MDSTLLSLKRRRTGAAVDDISEIQSEPEHPVPNRSDPELSTEQQSVINAVRHGDNIFLTGSAGVGKSVTLRAIISALREMYGPEAVAVCASTGIAAEPLGGSTLHSFAACGRGEYYRNFLGILSGEHRQRITKCAALVIDEISMVSGEFLDALCDAISHLRGLYGTEKQQLRQARDDPAFGGIQVRRGHKGVACKKRL